MDTTNNTPTQPGVPGKRPDPPPPPEYKLGIPPKQWRSLIWYSIFMMAFLWVWQEATQQLATRTIPYSEFKALVARGRIAEAQIEETEITGKLTPTNAPPSAATAAAKSETKAETNAPANTASITNAIAPLSFRTVRVEDPDLVKDLERAHVKYTGVRPSGLSQILWAWIIPLGVMFLLWGFISRRMSGLGQNLMSIGASKARLVPDTEVEVTFDDVAGCDEAKYELREVVTFLKNPARYKSLGATVPKGILLVGPPGTGKTLMARAVAGEAGVPFFLISGSDFVEMFVGVGAARVRDLFEKAKAQAPCIVFIDELDAVGRQRGVHMGMVNDEREQTLNQLLVGMDGFEPNVGVIVLAATNRPEVLDRALLRPGRFDRQVVLDAPDLEGRLAILKLHVRNKPLASSVELRRIAQQTPGFSGADLANLLNEAALLAARHDAHEISQYDLENAVEKVVAGPERKSRRLNDEEKRRVAFHEVGHALVAAHSPHADPVHKISIIPHGHAALGYTMQLPAEDRHLMNRSALLDKIKSMLGGRAAEEIVFAEVSTGAENDLEHATALARQMVAVYGMSDVVGLAHCAQRPGLFPNGMADGMMQRDCSEQTAREIDQEVKKILDQAYADAKGILREHRDQLDAIAGELLAHETIDGRRFLELIGKDASSEKTKEEEKIYG